MVLCRSEPGENNFTPYSRIIMLMSLYVIALFVALTPGVLLTLPKGGARLTVAVVHGLVFALVYHFTHKAVARFLRTTEGFAKQAPKGKCNVGMYGACTKDTDCSANSACGGNNDNGFMCIKKVCNNP